MNVLDYSIRLGKLLRKTEEGRSLLQLETGIEEKYKNNDTFCHYEQFAERNTSQYYFYSWDMAYKTFINMLTDDSIEHRDFFIPTAELISVDEGIKTLASTAVAFGNTFEKIVAVIISGGEYETIIPGSWKYKVKNAISDIQIAVERTLLIRTIAVFYQMHPDLLNNAATQKYLTEREEKKLLPFSQKAFEMMSEAKDVSKEEKVLYEKIMAQLSLHEFTSQQISPPVIVTMTMPEQELFLEANKWELAHGGLSGRTAQQFIDYLLGQVKS